MKIIKFILILILFLSITSKSRSQNSIPAEHNSIKEFKYNFYSNKILQDTNENRFGKSKVQKVNAGGVFLSPTIGYSFPMGNFGNYSIAGLLYGAKIELAYSRLYPFIFGFIYEYQKNKGSGDFTTANFLTQFDTKMTSIGGSLDIILNKYLKSNFTTPIFSLEVKYLKVSRDISPAIILPGIVDNESLLSYSAGLGFTIYIFDISGKYTIAKDYTNLTFQTRFHFPIIKF